MTDTPTTTARCTAVLEKPRANTSKVDSWRCALPAGHYGDTHYATSGWKWYGTGRTRRQVGTWLPQAPIPPLEATSWTATLLPPTSHVWSGNRLPVPYDPARCLYCGHPAQVMEMTQDPLFIHAGYGAAVRTVSRWCPNCHYSTLVSEESVRPHLQMALDLA